MEKRKLREGCAKKALKEAATKKSNLTERFMSIHEKPSTRFNKNLKKVYEMLDKYGTEKEDVDKVFNRATLKEKLEMVKLLKEGVKPFKSTNDINDKLHEIRCDAKTSLTEYFNANNTVQEYVDEVGSEEEGEFTLIKSCWIPTNKGKLNVGFISLDEDDYGVKEGLVCIPSYDVQFIASLREANEVYEMLHNADAEAFEDMDAFIAKFRGCSYARSVKELLDEYLTY